MRLGLLKASLNFHHDIIKGLSLGDIELESRNIIPILMSVLIRSTLYKSPFTWPPTAFSVCYRLKIVLREIFANITISSLVDSLLPFLAGATLKGSLYGDNQLESGGAS